jgi:hypothetical protein
MLLNHSEGFMNLNGTKFQSSQYIWAVRPATLPNAVRTGADSWRKRFPKKYTAIGHNVWMNESCIRLSVVINASLPAKPIYWLIHPLTYPLNHWSTHSPIEWIHSSAHLSFHPSIHLSIAKAMYTQPHTQVPETPHQIQVHLPNPRALVCKHIIIGRSGINQLPSHHGQTFWVSTAQSQIILYFFF